MRRLELYNAITNNAAAVEWARMKGLLAVNFHCPICRNDMKIMPHKCVDEQIWQCRKMANGTRHDSKMSIRHNSVFSGSNLSIRDIIFVLYEWVVCTSVEKTAFELGLSVPTVILWFKTFRETANWFVEQRVDRQIGGQGEIVEVDECQIGRRKHHRGRQPNEVWFFGAIVRDAIPEQLVIQPVRKRDRSTLEAIIQSRIHVLSRIVSDGWGGYSGLRELGLEHSVVNHSENFVSPTDPTVHTQNIENLWRCLRRFLNSRTAYSRKELASYVQEFIFRKTFVNHFETIISALEAKYPVWHSEINSLLSN
jgi:hypothetical protein